MRAWFLQRNELDVSVDDKHGNHESVTRAMHSATAVVTGAGGGIGRALAIAIGGQGAQVVIAGRRSAPLTETADSIVRAGGRAIVHVVDLTSDDGLARFTEAVDAASGGRLAALVHCAALHATGAVDKISLALFDEMLNCNLRSPFVLTRRLLPSLLRGQGDIVFMNSSAVFNPRADNSTYTASKAALKSFADCLRAELNPAGVRVLTVYPGRTATPMQAEIFAAEGRPYRPELLLQPEDVASSVLGAILLPRTAELTELQIRPALKG